MAKSSLSPMFRCTICQTLFTQPILVQLPSNVSPICPNPSCHGPIELCEEVMTAAVNWLFMHTVIHSGYTEEARMQLRCIAESQMGPWDNAYRSL